MKVILNYSLLKMASTAVLAAGAAKSLVNNPQFRGMVTAMAKGGVRAVGRSRARRAKRGKYYVGKRLGIPPNRHFQADITTRSLPASYDTTQRRGGANSGGVQVVKKSEIVNVDVDCETGDNGALYNWAISPGNVVLFPILSQVAKNYSRYRFKFLAFRFVSSSSTANDGNICLAWDLQAHSNDGDFPNLGVIQSLPRNVTGTIRQPCALQIPTQGTYNKSRYLAVPDGQAFDPLNYYAGQFVVACFGTNKSSVGQLFVDYECELSNAKVDLEASTAMFSAVSNVVYAAGKCQIARKNSAWYFSSNVPMLLHCDQYASGAAMSGYPTVELDETGIDPYRQFATATNDNNLSRFVIPAHKYGAELTIEPDANATSCTCYLTEHILPS
jgi:hypothetical protein